MLCERQLAWLCCDHVCRRILSLKRVEGRHKHWLAVHLVQDFEVKSK